MNEVDGAMHELDEGWMEGKRPFAQSMF